MIFVTLFSDLWS